MTASDFFVPFPAAFKLRLLQWLRAFPCVAFYDSNNFKSDPYATHDCIAACANVTMEPDDNPFAQAARLTGTGRYVFGYFGYDLKNKIEKLHSDKPNRTGFSDAALFTADIVFELNGNQLRITTHDNAKEIFEAVNRVPLEENEPAVLGTIAIKHRTPKEKYLQNIEALRGHIEEGHFYEINYCQEFFCANADINPDVLFHRLKLRSAAPFSAYLKLDALHLISASPERFLKRVGDKLVSQPIKGTIRRDLADPVHDEQLKETLRHSEKDQAENVMIVDLVRNDMNRVAVQSSVTVPELFAVCSFPAVHHMVSTVEATLRPGVGFESIFRALFPMGSMTGAPKVEVMKAIEFYEDTARGAFSGAAGYLTPYGDFDFNVVIRTILWNAITGYLSYHTGGAITYDSDPEAEYAESMLKAEALAAILQTGGSIEK